MQIACIGWGSLIWDPRDLLIQHSEYREDAWCPNGPDLPIEFARVSRRKVGNTLQNDRLTLVLVPGARVVRTLWTLFTVDDLQSARESLRIREGVSVERSLNGIAHWMRSGSLESGIARIIADWAIRHHLDAAIWTYLTSKFGEQENRTPSSEEVIGYLTGLTGGTRSRAEEYVRKTPRQIRTAYREAIEHHLGWTPIGRV